MKKKLKKKLIISYQAITGNNNKCYYHGAEMIIISYQAITGNNNSNRFAYRKE